MRFHKLEDSFSFPQWTSRKEFAAFLHDNLKPYEDRPEDIERGIDYAFSDAPGMGGFVLIAEDDKHLVGGLVMLKTGMKGYIPENLLLFVAVDKNRRGKGIGRRLIEDALHECEGDVCLHVEYENPAKRLYERMGFTSKYAEMRLKR